MERGEILKKEINTFLGEEIEEILLAIDELIPIRNFERRCSHCGNIITPENIYSISRINGEYCYLCNNPNCIESQKV